MDEDVKKEAAASTTQHNDPLNLGTEEGFGHAGKTDAQVEQAKEAPYKAPNRAGWFQKPSEIGFDRYIELVLTCSIAFFAFVQWRTTISNNAGTSDQTDKLILSSQVTAMSAEQNAAAARSFAKSAAHINSGVQAAVVSLGQQAKGTAKLAKIQQQAEIGKVPGVPNITFERVTCYRTKDKSVCDMVLSNSTGKTTAINIYAIANVGFRNTPPSDYRKKSTPLKSVVIQELSAGPSQLSGDARSQRFCKETSENAGKNFYIWGTLNFSGPVIQTPQHVTFCKFVATSQIQTHEIDPEVVSCGNLQHFSGGHSAESGFQDCETPQQPY